MKKVLLLGGTGFLGKNLAIWLQQNGWYVCIYARHSCCDGDFDNSMVSYVQGDFSCEEKYDNLLNGISVVFHLISTTMPANKDVLEEFQNNVIPTIQLLRACQARGIRIIYFSSGGTVYGVPRYLPIDEGHRTDPISPYGIQKLSIEKCLEYYGWMYGLDYFILRISNPYGIFQNPSKGQGAIAVFLARALMDQSIQVWGDGSVVRDYIYIEDVMRACIAILEYKGKIRIFNVGSGMGYSVKEILSTIELRLEKPLSVNYVSGRRQDVPANILSTKLLEKECAWRCKIKLDEGIDRMLTAWDSDSQTFKVRV